MPQKLIGYYSKGRVMSVHVWRFFQILIYMFILCSLLLNLASLLPLFNSIIFLYPVYHSILAIENENKEEKMKWLMYWVIYSSFSRAERLTGVLYMFPGYHKLKVLFLLWCMAPANWNGSKIIYFNVIRPLFLMHSQEQEKLIETAQKPLEEANTKKQVPQKTNMFTQFTKTHKKISTSPDKKLNKKGKLWFTQK